MIERLGQDLRYTVRGLRRNPAFAIGAVLTLALGMGANTAIFSLVNGVVLRPLPYVDGEELVLLRQSAPIAEIDNIPFSIMEVYDYREQNSSLKDLVEYHSMTFTLLGRGDPERVNTGVVSATFFDVLGVQPLLGRTFREEDDAIGAEAVLVLGHGYWQRAFGGDPGIVDQVFEMNNRPHRVVGVLPEIPQFPRENDVYMSVSACPFRAGAEATIHENRSAFRGLTAFGRLQSGATLAAAQTEFDTLALRFMQDHPETYPAARGYRIRLSRLHDELTTGARPTLWILLATSSLVLLIACANVANLTVARLIRRERELAVRAALGASRGRIVGQVLVESAVISLVGGGLGLLIAYAGLDLLTGFIGRFTPRVHDIEIDGTVLAFSAGIALFIGLLAGVGPAITQTRGFGDALRGTRGATSAGRLRLRSALIVAQVAVSLVLLVGAGLLLRSFHRLQQVDPGFATENILAAEIDLNWSKYQARLDWYGFFESLLGRVRAHPGVVSAATCNGIPLSGQSPFIGNFRIENREIPDGGLAPRMSPNFVSTDYFRTMSIPLVRGRVFETTDTADTPPVVVISQSLARKYWGDENPIGQRVSALNNTTWSTIVGIVGDVRRQGLNTEAGEDIYMAVAQNGTASRLTVRTASDPLLLARDIKELVWAIDPGQPISNVQTMAERRGAVISSERLTAMLLGLFALLALFITAAGVSSVIAFSVSQRTREFGVRMALGARASTVLWMVLRQGLSLVAIGLVLGLAGSLALGRLVASLLFETHPNDPLTLVGVSGVLLASAALACLLPARRATAVDPTVALRAE